MYHPHWSLFLSAETQWKLPFWKLLHPRRSSPEGFCVTVVICEMNSRQLIISVFPINVQITKCSSGVLHDIMFHGSRLSFPGMEVHSLSGRALWLIILTKKITIFVFFKKPCFQDASPFQGSILLQHRSFLFPELLDFLGMSSL